MLNESRTPQAQRAGAKWRLSTWWTAGLVVILLGGYAGLAGLAWSTLADARQFGERTMREFPGDEVEALVGLVQAENRTLDERGTAVHALGQIGSDRAIPVLRRYYTGQQCDHSRGLCQKELRKAIDRCGGRNWAPSWLPFFPKPPVHAGA